MSDASLECAPRQTQVNIGQITRFLVFCSVLIILELVADIRLIPHLPRNSETISPPFRTAVTRVNVTSDVHWPKIYYCQGDGNAIGEAKAMLSTVLAEYEFVDWTKVGTGRRPGLDWPKIKGNTSNAYDIFLMPVYGSCQSIVSVWIAQRFRGKVVYISGEDTDVPVIHDNTYLLGPAPTEERGNHVLQIYYVQMIYWQKFHLQSTDKMFWNHTLKPRNTGRHFLIYANANCVPFREEAFDELSRIGKVYHGGRCQGHVKSSNKTAAVTNVTLRNWWDNVEIYKNYRFCLVMEHGKVDGYITEKILMAFAGGCIPIYYGTKEVWGMFNREAFIYYDIEDPKPALEHLAYLERNVTAYSSMMDQPIFSHGNKTIEDFFSFSDDFGGGKAKEQIREALGLDRFEFIKPIEVE